jgi:hypothetical protein
MGKKSPVYKYLPGYSGWSLYKIVHESKNVGRWNPWLAHEWLDEVAVKCTIDVDNWKIIEKHDEAVDYLNAYWQSLPKMRYYNEKEFWAGNPPKMLAKIVPDVL